MISSDTSEKALQFKAVTMDRKICQWGADEKVINFVSLGRWGAVDASSGTESGEEIFAVYIQRLLIVVIDNTKVFDPGGEIMAKEPSRNLMHQ